MNSIAIPVTHSLAVTIQRGPLSAGIGVQGSQQACTTSNKRIPTTQCKYAEEDVNGSQSYQRLADSMEKQAEYEGFLPEEIQNAKRTVAELIQAGEGVEEMIVDMGRRGQLDDVILFVIQNRLKFAHHDGERGVIECLDLLYRRVETEMQAVAAPPALRLLNDLLHSYQGGSYSAWLRDAKETMQATFVPEDPFMVAFPIYGVDLANHYGPVDAPPLEQGETEEPLLRVDFINEVAKLLDEVQPKGPVQLASGMDPQSVALRMKQEETLRVIQQVKDLQQLAIELDWPSR